MPAPTASAPRPAEARDDEESPLLDRPRQIVLVRMVEDWRLAEPGRIARTDLGERPKIEIYHRPEACMWLRRGTAADVANAREFAKREGYQVRIYGTTERDPLGRAKREASK